MTKTTVFEVYKDKKGHFRWKLLSRNGDPVAEGGEGYSEKRGAMNAVKKLKDWSTGAIVVDKTILMAKPVAKMPMKSASKKR